MRIVLEILTGMQAGHSETILEGQNVRFGRSRRADFKISQDSSLSGIHFSVECGEEFARIRDLKSQNGTFVNDEKIEESFLRTGDRIQAGNTFFAVRIDPITSIIPSQTFSPSAPAWEPSDASTITQESHTEFASVSPGPQDEVADLRPDFEMEIPPEKNTREEIPPGAKKFLLELYQEHVEEASFLYAQRLAMIKNKKFSWKDLGSFEERLDAHLDALGDGDGIALEVCGRRAATGDQGELFSALCVFLRNKHRDLILKALENLDASDLEKMQAVRHAFQYELPKEWSGLAHELLPSENGLYSSILAAIFGFRRDRASIDYILTSAQKNSSLTLDQIWSLGRIATLDRAKSILEPYLNHDDHNFCNTTATALLRLGDANVIRFLEQEADTNSWACLPLALGGGPASLPILRQLAQSERVLGDHLLALGILGDPSLVEILLGYLESPELAESAAHGLNLFAGTDFMEEVFVPEEIVEDELFEDELKKWRESGERPFKPNGEPYGETVTRISQNPADWKAWWTAIKPNINPRLRYRRGKPYSPATLLESLESEITPSQIRRLIQDELVIRYGFDMPFEIDMFVTQQKKALAHCGQWNKSNGEKFKKGSWYFSGNLLK